MCIGVRVPAVDIVRADEYMGVYRKRSWGKVYFINGVKYVHTAETKHTWESAR